MSKDFDQIFEGFRPILTEVFVEKGNILKSMYKKVNVGLQFSKLRFFEDVQSELYVILIQVANYLYLEHCF